MVVIPAGTFSMGSPDSEAGRTEEEGPQIRIRVASFAAARHETTFAEWNACVDDGGCGGHRPHDEGRGRGDLPAGNVTWHDAQAYAAWLTKKTGRPYRLLSEAEWEYAARAGATTQYSWGAVASHDYANYGTDECCGGHVAGADRWLYAAPVDSFPPNAFGLDGLLGNVWEWVEDCWNPDLASQPKDGSARKTGDCRRYVMRGGSYNSMPVRIRAAFRDAYPPEDHDIFIGFRVARSL
jgi:formylglycine-generating enzyme required for sulfatase activity